MRRDRQFAEHDALLAHPVERAVGAVLEHRLGLLIELLRLGALDARTGEHGGQSRETNDQTTHGPLLLHLRAPEPFG